MPADATHAWAVLMRAFPGSFPPAVFDALDLARLTEIHAVAIEALEAAARAAEG